jgi:hypothetical protein
MRSSKVGRWLPAIGLVVGLIFMAAAVALGQGSESGARPTAAQEPGAHGSADWREGHGGHRGFRGPFAEMAPEARCKERFAREAGFLAYLGAKLDLTAQQQTLWDTYQKAMLDAATKQRQTCLENSLGPESHSTALERRDHLQKLLQARLDGLQSTHAPLEALYQSLSPEQRHLLDRPFPQWAERGR